MDTDPRFAERPQVWPERSAALLACDQLHELRPTPVTPHIPAELRRQQRAEMEQLDLRRTPANPALFEVGELDGWRG
jgi:hypothetical protein